MACDPKTLAREASCFFCLPPGYYYPVKLAILARWLKILSPGADTSVAALMRDASCFACPPNAQLGPMRLALICEATNGPAPPPGPPVPLDFTIDLSSSAGSTVLIWTDAGSAMTIEIWKSVNGGAYALYDTVGGAVTTYTDVAAMGALDYWEYKVRAVSGSGKSAFTTPAGAANGITDNLSVNISFPNLIISYDVIAIDSNPALITASFPRLARSAALLFFDDTSLTSLSVPVLGGTISDIIGYNCTSLLAMSFPALVSVSNSVQLNGNSSATTANFGSITSVGTMFAINGCPSLTALNIPALTVVGNLFSVANNAAMASFTVPSLISVGTDFTITNCGGIAVLDFSSLVTVSGNFSFNLSFGAANIDVNLPALTTVGGDLIFLGCAANLKNINAAALTTVGTLDLSNCSGLVAVTFTSLVFVTIGDLNVSDDVSLATLSFPGLTSVTGIFNTQNCTSLTGVSAPVLTVVNEVKMTGCSSLATVDFSNLDNVSAGTGNFDISNNASLTSISLTNLANLFNFSINGCTSLPSLSLPKAGVSFNNDFDASGCTSLITASFGTGAAFNGALNFQGCTAMTSLSLVDAMLIPGAGQSLNASGCTSLVTVTLGNAVFSDTGQMVTFDSDSLNQASVDAVLHRGVVSAVTSLDFELNSPGNSAPSVTGLADKATLILSGCTVNTN